MRNLWIILVVATLIVVIINWTWIVNKIRPNSTTDASNPGSGSDPGSGSTSSTTGNSSTSPPTSTSSGVGTALEIAAGTALGQKVYNIFNKIANYSDSQYAAYLSGQTGRTEIEDLNSIFEGASNNTIINARNFIAQKSGFQDAKVMRLHETMISSGNGSATARQLNIYIGNILDQI